MAGEIAFRWRRGLWVALLALLALLGVSVVVAIYVVLSKNADVAQLTIYAVLAALAAGVMFGASKLADFRATRYTGVFAMALLMVLITLALLAWGFENEGTIAAAASLALLYLPAVAMFQATCHGGGRISGIIGLSLLAATWIVIVISEVIDLRFQLWEIVWALFALAMLLPLALAGARTDRRYWRWAGALAIALGISLDIYRDMPGDGFYVNHAWLAIVYILLLAAGFVAIQANLTLLWRLPSRNIWLRRGAIGIGWVAATLFCWGSIGDPSSKLDENLRQIGIALGICAAAGTVTVAILALASRKSEAVVPVLRFAQMSIVCPHCQTQQTVAIGESACRECGLRFNIDAREPTCAACGYVLLMNRSAVCPECGEKV
jgi:hypothetical protein